MVSGENLGKRFTILTYRRGQLGMVRFCQHWKSNFQLQCSGYDRKSVRYEHDV